MRIDSVRTVYKSVCNRAAAGKKQCSPFILPISDLESSACREPITGPAFDRTRITAHCIPQEESLVGVSIEVLIVDEEVSTTEIIRETLRAYSLNAQIHVGKKGEPREVDAGIPYRTPRRIDRTWVIVGIGVRVKSNYPAQERQTITKVKITLSIAGIFSISITSAAAVPGGDIAGGIKLNTFALKL